MMWPLALLVLLAASAPDLARADADPVMARLGRIARGEWRVPETRPIPRRGQIPYAYEIRRAAERHGVAPSLLAALVRVESGFERRAISVKGALGLGQLMPRTAQALGVRDPFDVEQNLDGAACYLAEQLAEFGTVELALGAYNAGPTRMRRGLARAPRETRGYVRRVLSFERRYRAQRVP